VVVALQVFEHFENNKQLYDFIYNQRKNGKIIEERQIIKSEQQNAHSIGTFFNISSMIWFVSISSAWPS
jgi:hypothetical protein